MTADDPATALGMQRVKFNDGTSPITTTTSMRVLFLVIFAAPCDERKDKVFYFGAAGSSNNDNNRSLEMKAAYRYQLSVRKLL